MWSLRKMWTLFKNKPANRETLFKPSRIIFLIPSLHDRVLGPTFSASSPALLCLLFLSWLIVLHWLYDNSCSSLSIVHCQHTTASGDTFFFTWTSIISVVGNSKKRGSQTMLNRKVTWATPSLPKKRPCTVHTAINNAFEWSLGSNGSSKQVVDWLKVYL